MRRAIERVPGLQAARRYGMWLFMETFVAGITRVRPLGRAAAHLVEALHAQPAEGPGGAAQGRPDYPFGCKRILFSSEYLPALQRPDVELVTDEVERITPAGVVTADGREREVDCIVYGTGFRSNDFVMPMTVTGTGGMGPSGGMGQGAEAHLGMSVSGFPNMFVLYGPNTNLGVGSIIVMIEAQVGYVMDALRTARSAGAALEVRPEVQAASGEASSSGCATRCGRAAATGTGSRGAGGW